MSSGASLPMTIAPEARNAEGLAAFVRAHSNIRFISLTGIDLGGSETDERIPVSTFLADAETLLTGGVQTDGSSIALPEIATLNNGKIDLLADPQARWMIDYNDANLDPATGLPVGTVRIPAFLRHGRSLVDSRSVLARAQASVAQRLMDLLTKYPQCTRALGFDAASIDRILLTSATELEFWVSSPEYPAQRERLAVSQALKEQYWKPTKGAVRTGLERALVLLDAYGLRPEMGHKEVGGMDARAGAVMEQLEIDWRFGSALEAADNELLARYLITRAFEEVGLEVTFLAKPIDGVAGSGEHTHLGIAARLKDGTIRNLFAAAEPDADFLSPIGWGAVMGLLRRWEVVSPFVTCSTDAFNRLQPGFEAPVCIVGSVGHTVVEPSRNRSVLIGLVRDRDNPLATRFEVRAPNPYTNTFLAIAAMYQAVLDGVAYALGSGLSAQGLEHEFSKSSGEPAGYLETNRAYRSEDDVFEYFDQESRNRLFGTPPATVFETLTRLDEDPAGMAVLTADGVFDECIIGSYQTAMRSRWLLELRERILPANVATVRGCRRLHGLDEEAACGDAWREIDGLRRAGMQDEDGHRSLFTRVRQAIAEDDEQEVSNLQKDMGRYMADLLYRYTAYARNVVEPMRGEDGLTSQFPAPLSPVAV
jgi:glutamine synthetase